MIITFLFNSYAFSQDENFHIYLAFGQSNMEGQGIVSANDKLTDARIKVLQNFTCPNVNRTYGQWYTAAPPLFGCWGKLGIADYFAKTMANHLPEEISIGIVPTAVGGSDIALFQKSAPIGKGTADPEKVPNQFKGGYDWLLDLAKKAQQDGVIKGIIFHQGETNTSDPEWKYKVMEVIDDLRIDLNIGEIPFLSGELLYQSQGGCCGIHNTEILQLPNLINNAHIISAEGLDAVDVAHFTSASYREFGRRYAELMLTLDNSNIKPNLSENTSEVVDETLLVDEIITNNDAVDNHHVNTIKKPKTSSGGIINSLFLFMLFVVSLGRLFRKLN